MHPQGIAQDWNVGFAQSYRGGTDDVGFTHQTVASIEHNKYSPSLKAAFRSAEAFGVPSGEVFFWKAGEDGT